MNVIVRPSLSLAEFLAWEREQPLRYEFDGIQPIPMTGGTVGHARLVRRLMAALARQLPAGFEAFGGDLKVISIDQRVRYPDALVVRGAAAAGTDTVDPVVVFEVFSPSTALTELRIKPRDYADSVSILAYVILPQDGRDGATVLRRDNGWASEAVTEALDLPEIGVSLPLDELYGG